MVKKLSLLWICILGLTYTNFAQESAVYTNDLVDFKNALSLYNNKQYIAAQNEFSKIKNENNDINIQADCAYYIANCAVRLNQSNADKLVETFVTEYPTSIKRNSAFSDIANFYFESGKYPQALKWFNKIETSGLTTTEREQYYFNLGYAAFASKQYALAKQNFAKVENTKTYGSKAKYYIGYMAYDGDDYSKANEYFEQVNNQEQYKNKLAYYQADLNFKLGKFEKAIQLAKEGLNDKSREETSELSKIAGESYFNLKQYAEAIPYLQAYKGKQGKWNNTDYYQLGYAYYKQGNYDKAVSEFNKIISGDNAIAQNAYYHLGESYIKLNKKQEALNAFKYASQMDFDLKIQEDAFLNYAKLSYELGNAYTSVPEVLHSYLNKYPKSAQRDTIESLLVDSYITSKNYKSALELLKDKTNLESKTAYQKVAFYRGLEVFNEGQFDDAKKLFNTSLQEQKDPEFTARATFWKAETDYSLGNFNDALIGYKQFKQQAGATTTPEYKTVDYNIGYTYFKQKNYTSAAQSFDQYLATANDKTRDNDAYLRLGDSYFMDSNYKSAINAYNKSIALNTTGNDYAYFQKAISIGYVEKPSAKISALEQFIAKFTTSKLRDDALYELGNTLVNAGEINKAHQVYNQLTSEYKMSAFVPKTLMRQGLMYYNENKNEQALAKFKNVAENYKGSSEAVQAVSTARLIYIDLGQVEAYAKWVKTLGYVEVTNSDLDNATYQAAEKQYLSSDTEKAITLFNTYLSQFPKGLYALQANFYLAQLYHKKNLPEKASTHYEYVVNAPQNEFSEESLLRLSQYQLEAKKWNTAVPLLKKMETVSSLPQNILFAQSNLMKAYYQLKNYSEAESYAEKVLANPVTDAKIQADAHIIIARSAMQNNNEDKAEKAYAKVEPLATGETAAEALYYNAYFKSKAGQFEASNETIQKLTKNYSSYKNYSAKGLILMAKNFYALNDAFQATYILESIITNFKDYKEIVDEASAELKTIKAKEAKTNASIPSEGN